jgi:hypothetical protein
MVRPLDNHFRSEVLDLDVGNVSVEEGGLSLRFQPTEEMHIARVAQQRGADNPRPIFDEQRAALAAFLEGTRID